MSLPAKPLFTAFMLLVYCTIAHAAKDHDWLTGTVLDSQRSSYFTGTSGRSYAIGTAVNTSETADYVVFQNFVVEGGQYTYIARELLKWRWSKPADLVINGPVKYVIEKHKLRVVDDEGKEHTMDILSKTLRNSKGPAQ